jgi:hypothetical protein
VRSESVFGSGWDPPDVESSCEARGGEGMCMLLKCCSGSAGKFTRLTGFIPDWALAHSGSDFATARKHVARTSRWLQSTESPNLSHLTGSQRSSSITYDFSHLKSAYLGCKSPNQISRGGVHVPMGVRGGYRTRGSSEFRISSGFSGYLLWRLLALQGSSSCRTTMPSNPFHLNASYSAPGDHLCPNRHREDFNLTIFWILSILDARNGDLLRCLVQCQR